MCRDPMLNRRPITSNFEPPHCINEQPHYPGKAVFGYWPRLLAASGGLRSRLKAPVSPPGSESGRCQDCRSRSGCEPSHPCGSLAGAGLGSAMASLRLRSHLSPVGDVPGDWAPGEESTSLFSSPAGGAPPTRLTRPPEMTAWATWIRLTRRTGERSRFCGKHPIASRRSYFCRC